MAVIDRITRRGDRGKRVLVGPAELAGPKANSQRQSFAALTRITGSVDVYEITDGSGASEGTYTVTVSPYSENGFAPTLQGVGRVALVRQADGATNAAGAAAVLALRQPASRSSAVSLGPAAVATSDRLFVVIERRDTATLKYQLAIERVLDAITISAQPQSVGITAPAPTSFSVTASTNDGGSLSYQWQLSTDGGASFSPLLGGGVYSGITTDTLTISDSTGLSGNQYRVVISSSGGSPSVTSDAATLTLI
jgi:hypothetical protein